MININYYRSVINIAVLMLGLLTLGTIPVRAENNSFGVSPSRLVHENLMPGSFVENTFYISRANPDTAARAQIEISSELANIITLPAGYNVLLPKGVNNVPFTVATTIAEDAQLEALTGNIYVKLLTDSDSQINISPAIKLEVSLKIDSKAQIKLRVISGRINNIIVGEPLNLTLRVRNEGNVASSQFRVMVTIKDIFKNPVTKLSLKAGADIPPFTQQDLNIPLQTDNTLAVGQYFAELDVLYNSKKIYTDLLSFSVNEVPIQNLPETGPQPTTIIILAGLLIAILAGSSIIILKLRKKKNSHGHVKHRKKK